MIPKRKGKLFLMSDQSREWLEQGRCPRCGKPKNEWAKGRCRDWRCCSVDCSRKFYKNSGITYWQQFKEKALERDDWTCVKCGFKPENRQGLIVDHIKAIALGGEEFELENLQTLCDECNKKKTANDLKLIALARKRERLFNGNDLIKYIKPRKL